MAEACNTAAAAAEEAAHEPAPKRQCTEAAASSKPAEAAPVPVPVPAPVAPVAATEGRQKKRKVALALGYLGAGYNGMQENKGVRTIESVLEEAIHKAGGIEDINAGSFQKVKWSRSSRTDKGVSAACNVVGLKMIVDDGIVDRINTELKGTSIHVYGYCRTTNGFCARKRTDNRAYEYIVPTFAFQQDPIPPPPENVKGASVATPASFAALCEAPGDDDDCMGQTPAALTPAVENVEHWPTITVDNPILAYVREVLRGYEKSHNFHNFTVKKSPQDKSCHRFIHSFTCTDPFVVSGMQLVSFQVVGQSFMLLQVRKMVGFVLALARQRPMPTPTEAAAMLTHLFAEERHGVPTAPALSLFLDHPLFTHYNQLYSKLHGVVGWEPYQEKVEHMKREVIHPAFVAQERAQHALQYWLYMTDSLHVPPILPIRAGPDSQPHSQPQPQPQPLQPQSQPAVPVAVAVTTAPAEPQAPLAVANTTAEAVVLQETVANPTKGTAMH
eukprot:TRINITY_DN284_c5_g1_i1.p1 TRINITY_DN284_c5_g1~~TRINITY_DN284_c5_g1_i1.p1  ORF type:complete len:500 (-),score=131.51 TRINITY_DN284_c5_g1_i1:97-1596(-)